MLDRCGMLQNGCLAEITVHYYIFALIVSPWPITPSTIDHWRCYMYICSYICIMCRLQYRPYPLFNHTRCYMYIYVLCVVSNIDPIHFLIIPASSCFYWTGPADHRRIIVHSMHACMVIKVILIRIYFARSRQAGRLLRASCLLERNSY